MAARKVPFLTPEEYLAGERDAEVKHEYISGEAYAMAGGTPEHSDIASDAQTALAIALRGRNSGCETNNSDLRVRVSDAGPFFYPDVTVRCGDPTFDDDGCLRNPILIIEVLSEGTASFDRGTKFLHYRRIPSLRHYVLIEPGRPFVEHWAILDSGIWGLIGQHEDLNESVVFSDLGIVLPLTEIYRRIRFSVPPGETA